MDAKPNPARGLGSRLTQYGDPEFAAYLRRSFANAMGLAHDNLEKPVIGIVNTFSELNHCHLGLNDLAAAVKRGVWASGGLPVEFPVISLGEAYLTPSAMMFRNLMAMDVETMLRAQPLDGVVLLGGCDKTLPALMMGAASANLPSLVVATGPMLTSHYEGERIGACTDCRRYWAAYRRGEVSESVIQTVERRLAPTHGTCGVMGTASTMACLAETLGMMLPGTATIPAVYADRQRAAEQTGRTILDLVRRQQTPLQVLTRPAFENAIRVLLAIGGSTNAVIHLTAIAGRVGIRLSLQDFDRLSDETPVLLAVKPNGEHYMEDFHRAGGLPAVLGELRDQLHLDTVSASGVPLANTLPEEPLPDWQSVVFPFDRPFQSKGSLVALFGNLAPRGALLKRSAASPELLQTSARAVVFDSLSDLHQRIDSPDLDVQPGDALILKQAGPLGAPGMPEAGYLPIPKKLTGVKDMLRLSDARMSGTAFGSVVLHIAPEAEAGGPLALVETGDRIEIDVAQRRLNIAVSEEELSARRQKLKPNGLIPPRGYESLFHRHVQQADLGCDFDFLRHTDLQTEDATIESASSWTL